MDVAVDNLSRLTEEKLKAFQQDMLAKLFEEQKVEQTTPSLVFGTENADDLLASFHKRTKLRKYYYQEAIKSLLRGCQADTVRWYWIGRLFQDVALIYHVNKLREQQVSEVLLSPDRILSLYQALHPSNAIINNPFGMSSLKGMNVPDGIAADRDEHGACYVCEVVECTMRKNEDYFRDKYSWFTQSQSQFPHIFHPQTRLCFIVPDDRGRVVAGFFRDDTVRVEVVPIMFRDIQRRAETDFTNYSPDEFSCTAADMSAVIASRQRKQSGIQTRTN